MSEIKVQAATKYLSIVPENGETFQPGQKIIYNIEADVGYLKKDSYLVMDVANVTADNGRCGFGIAGIHSIIRDVNIYAKDTGVLLESLQNYGQWAAIENQYMHDDKTQLGIKEGVQIPCKINHQSFNNNNPVISRNILDPHIVSNTLISPVDNNGAAIYLAKRFCFPLRSGIFNHWSDDRLIPVLNMGGLRIEITLQDSDLVLQQMGSANNNPAIQNAIGGNPSGFAVRDINDSNTPAADENYGAVCENRVSNIVQTIGNLQAGTADKGNAVYSGQACIGGTGNGCTINFTVAGGAIQAVGLEVATAGTGGGSGYTVGDVLTISNATTGGTQDSTITVVTVSRDNGNICTLTHSTVNNCGFAVGNVLSIKDSNNLNAAPILGRSITAIAENPDDATKVDITVNGASIPDATNIRLRKVTTGANAPKYKIVNTEWRLCQVQPDKSQRAKLSKNLNYEYLSYDLFLDNIPSASLRHQIPINSVASKAKAIFTSLIRPNTERNSSQPEYYSGTIPTESLVNSIVYWINNRLYPLRDYNPNIKADKVLSLNEIVKSFKAINKTPLCLGDNIGQESNDYNQTHLICRELARNNFVFDLRNAEPEIRLAFSAARAEVLRAQSFVFSNKIIQTSATGVQVVL